MQQAASIVDCISPELQPDISFLQGFWSVDGLQHFAPVCMLERACYELSLEGKPSAWRRGSEMCAFIHKMKAFLTYAWWAHRQPGGSSQRAALQQLGNDASAAKAVRSWADAVLAALGTGTTQIYIKPE